MIHKIGRILGCVMGVSSQTVTDWTRWQVPILLQYCASQEPVADRLQRSEEMVRIEAAGFVPLAIVATCSDCQAGLELLIGPDTPSMIRKYLIENAQQIFDEALELESRRSSA